MVAVPSIGRASQVTPRRAAPEADATRDLYERYARQIHAYCLHQLGNREEAEDATQSTFLNAFRGIQRGVDPEFESAWLYKIAQNVCLTRQRSSSRRRRVESPGDLEAMQDYVPAHQPDSDELIGLPEALESMPEQQRRALLLREWQGLSYKEIADELDLSQAAVETLLFRARRTLANGLVEAPPKKASGGKRLRRSGDAGSLVAIVKSILLTGGTKVAATVATVAATSVVAATPATRHAVEEVVAPRHDVVPVQVASVAGAKPKAKQAVHAAAPAALSPRVSAPAAATRSHAAAPAVHHRVVARARRVAHSVFMPSHRSRVGVEPAAVAAAPPAPPSAAVAAPPAPVAQPPAVPAPVAAPVQAAPAATPPAVAKDDHPAAPQAQPSSAAPGKGDDKHGAPKNDDSDKEHAKKPVGGNDAPAVQPTAAPVEPAAPAPTPAQPAAAPAPAPAPSDRHSDKQDGHKQGDGHGGRRDSKAAPAPSAYTVAAAPTAPATTAPATTATAAPAPPTTTATTPAVAPTPPAAAPAQPAAAQPTPASTDQGDHHDGGHRGEGHEK